MAGVRPASLHLTHIFSTGAANGESDRASASEPTVARNELTLGYVREWASTPKELCHSFEYRHGRTVRVGLRRGEQRRNPVGVGDVLRARTQGSSFLATLGWRTQSLWDWRNLYAHFEERLGNGAHSYYNSLIRRIVSYAHALEREQ